MLFQGRIEIIDFLVIEEETDGVETFLLELTVEILGKKIVISSDLLIPYFRGIVFHEVDIHLCLEPWNLVFIVLIGDEGQLELCGIEYFSDFLNCNTK